MSSTSSAAAEALRAALELFDTGVALMRQNLRRHRPDVDEATIDRLLDSWLLTRPGAEHGDSAGRPRTLDTRRP